MLILSICTAYLMHTVAKGKLWLPMRVIVWVKVWPADLFPALGDPVQLSPTPRAAPRKGGVLTVKTCRWPVSVLSDFRVMVSGSNDERDVWNRAVHLAKFDSADSSIGNSAEKESHEGRGTYTVLKRKCLFIADKKRSYAPKSILCPSSSSLLELTRLNEWPRWPSQSSSITPTNSCTMARSSTWAGSNIASYWIPM